MPGQRPARRHPRSPELDRALAEGPFRLALQLAIERSGLTLDRLVARLVGQGHRISTTTLSNWQRGRTTPQRVASVRALRALAELLDVDPDRLHALLDREPRELASPDRLVPPADALQRLRERVGMERLGRHETLSLRETHVIGPDGLPTRHHTQQVVRPRVDGLDAYYYYFFLPHDGSPPDGEPRPPEAGTVEAITGCRVGELLFEPPDVACCALEFDRPVPRGQTHLFEYATNLDYDAAPEPEFRRAIGQPLEQILFRVQFHPDLLPERVTACTWDSPTAPPRDVAELVVGDDGVAHHLVLRPAAGIYGVRWSLPTTRTG